MGNVSKVEPRQYSSSMMVNTTFRVVHQFFEVDIDYMLMYVRNGHKFELDVMDYCGVHNLIIDGQNMSDEDCGKYFDLLTKMGVKHLEECCDKVEDIIKSLSQDSIEGWIFNINPLKEISV